MNKLMTLELTTWNNLLEPSMQEMALQHLEAGGVLYFPHLTPQLTEEETKLLTPAFLSAKRKNMSWDTHTQKLRGSENVPPEMRQSLSTLLERYVQLCQHLIHQLLPSYQRGLIVARSSFRPGAISQRVLSPRKDDRLLHVDAFPSTPFGTHRLLRVFSNINPYGEARLWRISGPFQAIAEQFFPKLSLPWPGKHRLLHLLRLTRKRRTAYDHLMLQLHDAMKEDQTYQTTAPYQEISFPPGSTWITCTDQVAHAALAGQYMLEQSFYFPLHVMQTPAYAPARILESLFQRDLIAL